jgi:NAD(P)-dependent dehydrogenase (short-subunit alcohol dehydrogenase family)
VLPDPTRAFRLDGQVAIVTGASSGLGERFAQVLHASGAIVVLAARRGDRLAALAARLGDGAIAVTADVAEAGDRDRILAAALTVGGRIDLLVNNAGIGASVAAEDETAASFRQVLDVNLTSLFLLSQLVGRRMLDQGWGSIVNVASVLGLVASAPIEQASYCASKGAVVNLTREMGAQWGRRGVRVNALAPGWFESEMTAGMWDDDRTVSYVNGNTPMGRHGAADELDGALLFLASRASSFVTGQVLAVDGGWTAR